MHVLKKVIVKNYELVSFLPFLYEWLIVLFCPADARTLVQQARNEAAEFRFRYGYEMPGDVLARWYLYFTNIFSWCTYLPFVSSFVFYVHCKPSILLKICAFSD